jgi:hypothetical protein
LEIDLEKLLRGGNSILALTQRTVGEPLKPKVAQKPAETKACLAMAQTRPILSTSPPSLEEP